MADHELEANLPFAAFDPSLMIPALALIGALLVGAVVIAFVRRWQQTQKPLSPSASDQLAEFRTLYEKGVISQEEFKRLRDKLGTEIRQVNNLPVPPTEPMPPVPTVEPRPESNGQPPTDGIRPA